MKVTGTFVNINSEDPQRLKAFYADVVGLPLNPAMGENAFELAGATLGIDGHSELKGKTKEPQRVLLDLFVDDLKTEQARIEGQGVTFIRKEGKEFWGGVISTFLDPDGNYCQLIEYKPQA